MEEFFLRPILRQSHHFQWLHLILQSRDIPEKKLLFDARNESGDKVLDHHLVQLLFSLIIVHHIDGNESMKH